MRAHTFCGTALAYFQEFLEGIDKTVDIVRTNSAPGDSKRIVLILRIDAW